MMKQMKRPLAVLALFALAACTNGGTLSTAAKPPLVPGVPSQTGGIVQQNFVGVGDSLTAGFQSGGLLGDPTAFSTVSVLPKNPFGGNVPITQPNGFFALMWLKYNGLAIHPSTYNLDTPVGSPNGPLPLIKAPGLGSQLVLSTGTIAPTHSGCDSFNDEAFSTTGWSQTRLNPAAPIADVSVPGITMHEVLSMVAPLTGPSTASDCGYVSLPGDKTSGALQSLVQGESTLFYPMLGQFDQVQGPGKATELSSAVALHPKLATVWLGGNDMLKFIESHGQSPVTDSPAQFSTDETQIITTLQKAGAQVVVADLPDILGHPSSGEPPIATFIAQTSLAADLQQLGVPAAAAGAVAAYVQSTYTKGPGGFVLINGVFSIVNQLQTNPTALPVLDPNGPGSGDGTVYLDQTFAAQAIALNDAYNAETDQIATGTGAALAPLQATFKSLGTTGVPLAPGVTLTTRYGGGLFSFDGIHPSDTGYALIANLFIQAADTTYSLSIPPLSMATDISGIAQVDPYNPFLIKAIDPTYPFPFNQ